jgi:hypothetical protein
MRKTIHRCILQLSIVAFLGLTTLACLGGVGAVDEWKTQQGGGFTFSYPADWNFNELNAAGESYLLYLPGRTTGTNIIVIRNPRKLADLDGLEEKLITAVENSQQVASGEVLEVSRVQLDNREAIQVRFSAVTGTTQEAFDGVQVGTLLPDGQAITITLGVFDDADRDLATQVFEEILDSFVIND